MLEANGGPIVLTKSWPKYLLSRMAYVKRRASTKGKKLATDFHELKVQFLFNIKAMNQMEEIPQDLVINWDQTGIHYVPVSSFTMEKEGTRRVELVGIDDKRQITAVFVGTMAGDFLPIQSIYKGKTSKCLPSVDFPEEWHITYTENHWAIESTMLSFWKKFFSRILN